MQKKIAVTYSCWRFGLTRTSNVCIAKICKFLCDNLLARCSSRLTKSLSNIPSALDRLYKYACIFVFNQHTKFHNETNNSSSLHSSDQSNMSETAHHLHLKPIYLRNRLFKSSNSQCAFWSGIHSAIESVLWIRQFQICTDNDCPPCDPDYIKLSQGEINLTKCSPAVGRTRRSLQLRYVCASLVKTNTCHGSAAVLARHVCPAIPILLSQRETQQLTYECCQYQMLNNLAELQCHEEIDQVTTTAVEM